VTEQLEMPEVFVVADRLSVEAQRRFMRSTRVQLSLLVLAGGAGAFSLDVGHFQVEAIIAGVAFVLAALFRLRTLRGSPHSLWYRGRAAAESVKTLSWRYAVGGLPFPISEPDSSNRYSEQIEGLLVELRMEQAADGAAAPTASMEALRSSPLESRHRVYAEDRIEDQVRWYRFKAEWNRKRAALWGKLVVGLTVLAAIGAFLRGFGVIKIDLLGLAAASAAAAAGWLETRQHGNLSEAYAITADDLAAVGRFLESSRDEPSWAEFVSDAEEAISREHTLWKASGSRVKPPGLV
jgi:hypothetical protein